MAEPLRIFIVENHSDTLTYLSRYLGRLGHTVHSAPDVETALREIPTVSVDLLLSDIGLPDGNGWEMLEQLAPAADFYAVAMSGRGAHSDKERSRVAGYRQHLIKPFLPQDLDSILSEAQVFVEARSAARRMN